MNDTGSPPTPDVPASTAWVRRLARTTPGVIGMIAVVVAACCVIAGLVCGGQLDRRIAEHNAVLDHSEPLAYSAQKLYAALSAADAAAAAEFLSGGVETGPMRARYNQALADVASALADVTAGTTDTETRTAVAEMSAKLTAYTGLVEAARANNRQGFVIGSAYLREASSLMQNALLPGAETIYAGDLSTLNDDQRAVGSVPIVSLVLLGLVLAAIGVGSVILVGRTNRQFNLGLLVAAAVALLAIGWTVVAIRLAAVNIEHSQTEGTARFGQLAKARILAQQARTDETLALIARGDITAREKSFSSHIGELSALLGDEPPAAADAVAKWTATASRWRRTRVATTPLRLRTQSVPSQTPRPRNSPPSRTEVEQVERATDAHVMQQVEQASEVDRVLHEAAGAVDAHHRGERSAGRQVGVDELGVGLGERGAVQHRVRRHDARRELTQSERRQPPDGDLCEDGQPFLGLVVAREPGAHCLDRLRGAIDLGHQMSADLMLDKRLRSVAEDLRVRADEQRRALAEHAGWSTARSSGESRAPSSSVIVAAPPRARPGPDRVWRRAHPGAARVGRGPAPPSTRP